MSCHILLVSQTNHSKHTFFNQSGTKHKPFAFSRPFHRLQVFRRLPSVTRFFRRFHRFQGFPALSIGYKIFYCFPSVTRFPRPFHQLQDLPALSIGNKIFQPFQAVTRSSRAFHRLQLFPPLTIGFLFSRVWWQRLHVCLEI